MCYPPTNYISASCWGLFPIDDKEVQALKVHSERGKKPMPVIYNNN